MESIFSVAISCHNTLGYIEYNKIAKTANIVIDKIDLKNKIEEYLKTTMKILVPNLPAGDFIEKEINPLNSLEEFQLSLTRMWDATSIHVDWSRPVEYVKLHPTLDS